MILTLGLKRNARCRIYKRYTDDCYQGTPGCPRAFFLLWRMGYYLKTFCFVFYYLRLQIYEGRDSSRPHCMIKKSCDSRVFFSNPLIIKKLSVYLPRCCREKSATIRKRIFALFRNVKLDTSQKSNRNNEKMSIPCLYSYFYDMLTWGCSLFLSI